MRFLARLSLLASGALVSGVPGAQLFAQTQGAPSVTETVFELAGGGEMLYAVSLPAGYDGSPDDPRPLILALHPGGRSRYYGSAFMRQIVDPALRGWGAVIVAPDVTTRSWANEDSDQAVLALLNDVLENHVIDRAQILVTGYSMGGRGTWYLATRHADLFTGAIPIAASRGGDSLDGLRAMPVHLIHSPDDEVVPYGPAEETANLLTERGHRVQLTRLPGASHYAMGNYIAPLRAAGEWMKKQWQAGEVEVGR
jgi:predicted peptidase